MRNPQIILDFGIHRGKVLSDPSIPNRYIVWLAGMPIIKSKTNRFETVWKCPGTVWAAAMKEADKRGYEAHGEGWRLKGTVSMED